MYIKLGKMIGFLAFSSAFFAFLVLPASAENLPLQEAADKVTVPSRIVPGFYQFNNLEIFKGPSANEPQAIIEVIQKNEKNCVIYEGGRTNQPIPCVFNNNLQNVYVIQVEKGTTLLGINQEPALLTDFVAGDKITVLGWLLTDSKTISASVIRSLEPNKEFHQSFSGTIKKVAEDGFVLALSNGDEIFIKTPLVEGAQVTVKGVFDKAANVVSNVLSIFIRPNIVLEAEEKPVEPPAPKKPSTLFKNFLRVFGL